MRELAPVVRLVQLVDNSSADLLSYLSRLSAPTAHVSAALVLASWLLAPSPRTRADRRRVFSSLPSGEVRRMRGGEWPWDW